MIDLVMASFELVFGVLALGLMKEWFVALLRGC
jgi:hypothetical protein